MYAAKLRVPNLSGCFGSPAVGAKALRATTDGGSAVEWLTFAEGAVIGALTIAVSVVIAWRQRVIQVRDHGIDRQRQRARELERQEHGAKIARREKWQPEYEAIREHLDCGETLAYRVLLNGPYTTSEFDALDAATLRMNSEILAARGVERLHELLLTLASLVDDLMRNALPDQAALVATDGQNSLPDRAQPRGPLRLAVLQDRAARDLAELIKTARQALRSEWGD